MKKIIFLKGLPASGKSTYAKQLVDDNVGMYKRINKDDLRAMLDNSKWTKHNEKFVIKARDLLIEQALEDGFHVIVDDTNFHHKHELHIREMAKKHNAVVEVKEFDTPLDICIERDKNRPNSVGANIIISMYDRYVNNDISNLPAENVWITSDTHFTHQMLIDENIRPEDYNTQIIYNWNKVVGKDDTVVHLGDVIFGQNKERLKDILAQLNGTKFLVKGNHDYKPDTWYLEMGFDHVYELLTWNNIVFTHIPIDMESSNYNYNVHGHLHNNMHRISEPEMVKLYNREKHILYAQELEDYTPLRIDCLLDRHLQSLMKHNKI